jgi:hypothetical protein
MVRPDHKVFQVIKVQLDRLVLMAPLVPLDPLVLKVFRAKEWLDPPDALDQQDLLD